MQTNILNDLGTISKIPNKILTDLTTKECWCIGSAIKEAVDKKEDVAVLNIGLGTLSVNLADMQCKFIPSAELKSIIKKSLKDGVDPLEEALCEAFVEKLLKAQEEEY